MSNKNTKKRKLHEVSGEPLPERPPLTKRKRVGVWDLITYFEARVEEGLLKRKALPKKRDMKGLSCID